MNDPMDFRAFARAAALFCILALVVFSTLPGSERPHVFHSGSFEHFIAYAGTALLLAIGYTRRFAWAHISFLSGASAIFEIAQIWIPGRSAGIDNWAASTAGAFAGVVLAVYVVRPIVRRLALRP